MFHYQPGAGPLHRLDGRVKLLLLVLFIVTVFSADRAALALLTAAAAAAVLLVPLKLRGFVRELAIFGVLALVIFLTRPGFLQGAVAAWRFALVVTAGMLFTAVTGPEELHAVVFTLLAPIPLVSHGRIAQHVSLTLLFIPLLFDTAKEIGEARRSRMAGSGMNPVRRLTTLAVALLEAMFMRIEEVALALESRCYDEGAVRRRLAARPADIVTAAAAVAAAAFIIVS
jgi:energy-coupling factor transporter transmembrane protein EcfT